MLLRGVFFVESAIMLIPAITEAILALAAGSVVGVAKAIEFGLSKLIALVINLFAKLIGLGGLSKKVMAIFAKIRKRVDKAVMKLLNKAKKAGRKLLSKLGGKKKVGGKEERSKKEMEADLKVAKKEAEVLLKKPNATPNEIKKKLPKIKNKYDLKSIDLVHEKEDKYHIHLKINPDIDTVSDELNGKSTDNPYKATSLGEGKFKGNFEDFPDWNGYPNPVTVHPANKFLNYQWTKNVPKPNGKYIVSGKKTSGAPSENRESWRKHLDDKKNKYKELLAQKNPSWEPVDIENEAKKKVENQYSGWEGQYHKLWLFDWQGHHIKPVNWGGTDSKKNLQYLLSTEHSPFTTWWTQRKNDILKHLKEK